MLLNDEVQTMISSKLSRGIGFISIVRHLIHGLILDNIKYTYRDRKKMGKFTRRNFLRLGLESAYYLFLKSLGILRPLSDQNEGQQSIQQPSDHNYPNLLQNYPVIYQSMSRENRNRNYLKYVVFNRKGRYSVDTLCSDLVAPDSFAVNNIKNTIAFTLLQIFDDPGLYELDMESEVGADFQREYHPLIESHVSISNPVYSPDNQHLAFVRTQGNRSQLGIYDSNNEESLFLAETNLGISDLTWSPDSSRIVFSNEGSLVLYDLELDKVQMLTNLTNYDYAPKFTPDGSLIIFIRKVDDSPYVTLTTMEPNSYNISNVVYLEGVYGFDVSPDGQEIAVSVDSMDDNLSRVINKPLPHIKIYEIGTWKIKTDLSNDLSRITLSNHFQDLRLTALTEPSYANGVLVYKAFDGAWEQQLMATFLDDLTTVQVNAEWGFNLGKYLWGPIQANIPKFEPQPDLPPWYIENA